MSGWTTPWARRRYPLSCKPARRVIEHGCDRVANADVMVLWMPPGGNRKSDASLLLTTIRSRLVLASFSVDIELSQCRINSFVPSPAIRPI